ncbi:aminoglycoside 6-adenylyltransferase [Heyndrickxia acidicola]|uniref:Aminoglycoside 6-adenylyltransferase n=1 Tax=Heyndrickxia acidicola TaxID=209389 RepID=A0ABU6MHG2_9BACI|nr:aminoglycoside 6-adenylyltransferase [Heyndrickxia acidicola]MED1204115.1 aminoglycoside 6-adenylyltransferase [Heyndrickxia acidicola]
MAPLTYERIIEKFLFLCKEDENVLAVIIVGSQARTEMPADNWSDLDLVVFAENPMSLLAEEKWLHKLGNPYITFLENTAVGGGKERRVLFEEGLDVDFAVFPPSALSMLEQESEVLTVFSKGVKVLLDKDNFIKPMLEKIKDRHAPFYRIETKEIKNSIHDFWYHAVLAAKKLRRGELLDGKSICDAYMKNLLVSLIKTLTKLEKGESFNTWHGYRFFERWTDPSILQSFRTLYAHYDEKDTWNALKNTIQLFRHVAIKVCEKAEMEYPHKADEFACKLVEAHYQES